MSAHEDERTKQLLKLALERVDENAEPDRDLWPEILKRLDRDERAASSIAQSSRWVWFDVALLAGLAILGVSFPAVIPLLLYYL